MKSYDLHFTFGKDGPPRYYVEVFQQPWYRYVIGAVYHWYDMHIYKVPGFKAFERWHHKRFGKGDWTFDTLSCRQDIKCYFLSKQGKNVIAKFEVDSDTYDRLGGKVVKEA